MTTSILSYGRPKRKCASISSSPLFASVAESTVIFRPIRQVGCRSASSGVAAASSSRVRPRNGPPEAVITSESSSSARRPSSQLACRDEALLVRERERHPALERPERSRQPGEADDRVEDDVRLGALEQLGQVAAHLRQRRQAVDRLRARRRGDELELGVRGDDLERLPPDRTGGTQEGDALHRSQCRATMV